MTVFGDADADDTVMVFFDGVDQGSVIVNESGSWKLDAPDLGNGTYLITATSHDLAGNASLASEPITVTIRTRATPAEYGLWLLLPALICLILRGVWAYDRSSRWFSRWIAYRPEQNKQATDQLKTEMDNLDDPADYNPGLIIIVLLSWLAVFFWLSDKLWDDVAFFSPRLTIPLFVPAFGLLGAMMFIVDIFRQGKAQSAGEAGREFAWRLLLGPYVAIVVVLLSTGPVGFGHIDALKGMNESRSQAVIAFFSGFLVVVVLQWLTELFNTWTSVLRSTSRYEPSVVATTFKLDKEDDLKLRQAGLKNLDQLRELDSDAKLRQIISHTALEEQFLRPIVKRAQRLNLQASIGQRAWKQLEENKGVLTIEDIAALTSEDIKAYAEQLRIDVKQFTTFCKNCKSFVG